MPRTLAWGLIIVVREMLTRIVLPALHYAGTYERCGRLGDQSPVLHLHDDVAQSVYTIAPERADHLAAVIRNERILSTRLFQPRASIRPSSPVTASSKTHSFDAVYCNEFGLDERSAVDIRAALAERMVASSGWKYLRGKRQASIEMHIGPAIAALFFNDHGFTQPPSCCLLPKGIDRVAPFLPTLEGLTKTGASIFVALLTLNLLEVSERPEHL